MEGSSEVAVLLGTTTEGELKMRNVLLAAVAAIRPTASPGSAGGETTPAVILKIKDCKLDLAAHTFVDGNGWEVHLTRAETALLAAFVGNPCRVLSRDQLRRAVVGHGAEPYDRNVDMLVARLRRKIESDPKSPQFILTVPTLGYKFATRPQSVENGTSLSAIDLDPAKDAQTISASSLSY